MSVIGEHPVGAGVGLDAHHLVDQTGERLDAGGGLAPAVYLPAVDVPGREVGQRPTPAVVVFDPHHPGPAGRQGRMGAAAGLDGGFLIRADDEVVARQRLAVPDPGVQVQGAGGLDGEVGIPRGDPRAVLAGFERVVGQPPAHRGRRGRYLPPIGQLAGDLRGAPPRQRCPGFGRQGTRHRDGLGPRRVGEHRWAPAARMVCEAVQAVLGEPFAPGADGVHAHVHVFRDHRVRRPRGGREHQLRADPVAVLGAS